MTRRIPWDKSGAEAATEEEIELFSVGTEGAAEIEATAETTFITIEAAAAELDSTGVGLPVGITVGALALLGFGTFEIYEYFKGKNEKISAPAVHKRVQDVHKKAIQSNLPIPEKGKATLQHLKKIQNLPQYKQYSVESKPFEYT